MYKVELFQKHFAFVFFNNLEKHNGCIRSKSKCVAVTWQSAKKTKPRCKALHSRAFLMIQTVTQPSVSGRLTIHRVLRWNSTAEWW